MIFLAFSSHFVVDSSRRINCIVGRADLAGHEGHITTHVNNEHFQQNFNVEDCIVAVLLADKSIRH